jgi:hypothetical protein
LVSLPFTNSQKNRGKSIMFFNSSPKYDVVILGRQEPIIILFRFIRKQGLKTFNYWDEWRHLFEASLLLK